MCTLAEGRGVSQIVRGVPKGVHRRVVLIKGLGYFLCSRHFLGDSCDGWTWLCAELEARKWFLLPTGPLVINASNDHIAADHLGGEDKDGYTLLADLKSN